MMKILLSLVLTLITSAASAAATADPYFNITKSASGTGAAVNMSGTFTVAASTPTSSTPRITLSGSAGSVTAVGSVTASGFFGDGSHLTGIPSSGALTGYVPYTGASSDLVLGNHALTSTYRISVGSATPTQPLVVIGTAAINGELLFQGTGAKGRLTSSPYTSTIGGIDLSWNGHSSTLRDNAAVVGGYFRISDGATLTWGSDRYESMYYVPGSDEQGHMSLGFGNSSPYNPTNTVSNNFTIAMREGLLVGLNSSGNTKLTGNEGFAVEDTGRSNILLGNPNGRAWTVDSNAAGNLKFIDTGNYGVSNGGGTNLTITAAAGVQVATSSASGFSMCMAGSFQTLPASGYAEGCIAYQVSDHTYYGSTATVTNVGHWKALY